MIKKTIQFLTILGVGFTAYEIAKGVYNAHITAQAAAASKATLPSADNQTLGNPLLVPIDSQAIGIANFNTEGLMVPNTPSIH